MMYAGVPEALIRCVSGGFSATEGEVDTLAARIWRESAPARSAFAWGRLDERAPERLAAIRTAAIALNGCRTS